MSSANRGAIDCAVNELLERVRLRGTVAAGVEGVRGEESREPELERTNGRGGVEGGGLKEIGPD